MTMGKLIFENIRDLSLRDTLDCGQCFRWKETEDGGYRGVVRGRTATVRMDGERLVIDGAEDRDRALWRNTLTLTLTMPPSESVLPRSIP